MAKLALNFAGHTGSQQASLKNLLPKVNQQHHLHQRDRSHSDYVAGFQLVQKRYDTICRATTGVNAVIWVSDNTAGGCIIPHLVPLSFETL